MLFSQDIGIDLGTANTLIYMDGMGIVVREPSVVAYDVRNDAVRAVGTEAKEMIGRTPGSIVAVRPLKEGVIADFDVTAAMLKRFISLAQRGSFFSRTRVLISVPAGITEVEIRAVYDAVRQTGAEADLIEVPVAAALGAGLDISDASGNMIVDIGGGTTQVAIVSLGDIVTSQTIRAAGDHFDEAIINYVRRKHSLLIGERTAEQIKISIGSVLPYENEGEMEIKGRNLVDGLPKNVVITAAEVREALSDIVEQIVDSIRTTFEKTPPELAADIIDRGITLTGGGAMLRGMSELIEKETEMTVTVADKPVDCVIRGIEKKLDTLVNFDTYVFKRGKKYM